MKAVLCTHFGPPGRTRTRRYRRSRKPAAGEAVVRVKAAALNFFDTLIIAGKYQHKPPFPFSPAAEFAGVVESIGAGVDRHRSGRPRHGQYRLGRGARSGRGSGASSWSKFPTALDFDRAAGLTVTYGTTLYALRERAALKPGETLVVLGASGGTGLAAIEIGKIMGARVIACASSDEKLAFAREHGADETVNYASEDLRDALKTARRRARHRRGLRSGRRPLCGAGGALAGLGRPLSRGRLRRRRNSETSAQSGAAEKLRYPRRVLGHLDQARAGGAARVDDANRATGARKASSAPMSTRSIRWRRSRPRSRRSPTAR